MNNQRYIKLNIFYKYILKTRRAYQNLILYINMIIKDFRRKNDFKKNKNEFETLKTILSNIANFVLKTKVLLKVKRKK